METVENAARGSETQKRPFFKTVKDGNGRDIKVIDLDNPEVCKRTGLVELVPLREKKNTNGNVIHHSRVMFRRIIDGETKCSIGIEDGIDDKTKELKFRLITLEGRRVYDLSNRKDAEEWACIKYSPYLEGSPNQDRNAHPMYKVYDKERQAEDNLKQYRTKREAQNVAETLNGPHLHDMLKLCGIGTHGMSEVSKQFAIIKYAEDHPNEFLKHFNSPTRKEAFLLKEAVEFGVVEHNPLIGFLYGDYKLGENEILSIEYLVEHPNTATAIQSRVEAKKVTTDSSKSSEATKVVGEDVELAAAKARIAELERLVKTSPALEDVKTTVDPEMETLQAEAKHLKIKSWHVKGKETLRKEIELAKKG